LGKDEAIVSLSTYMKLHTTRGHMKSSISFESFILKAKKFNVLSTGTASPRRKRWK
jgi:hypothetical protein